ncbi:UNVERIFIED_CONTAM: hypothetical protein B566_EDAN018199 [Ephemera danica]|nr:hypothetical protein B566_EDAN018199 [Ephemera danica]
MKNTMEKSSGPTPAKKFVVAIRKCCVSNCRNTSRVSENTLFFWVPKSIFRGEVFNAIEAGTGVRPTSSITSTIYVCQHHYKLENDVEFWDRCNPATTNGRYPIRLKKGVVPSIFENYAVSASSAATSAGESHREASTPETADLTSVSTSQQSPLFKTTSTQTTEEVVDTTSVMNENVAALSIDPDSQTTSAATPDCGCISSRHFRHRLQCRGFDSPQSLSSQQTSSPIKNGSDPEYLPSASSFSSSNADLDAFDSTSLKGQKIIDAFEVETEKPGDAVHQALTWSDYKHCNTFKFLVSCTPDGHINKVSKAYGGRISDLLLAIESGYVAELKENTTILADRGFKFLEAELAAKSCKLLRPPSISGDSALTAEQSLVTKQIAALRIHVERVIGRLRDFACLAPHARVDHNMISKLDDIAVIAAGLVNLQNKITRY